MLKMGLQIFFQMTENYCKHICAVGSLYVCICVRVFVGGAKSSSDQMDISGEGEGGAGGESGIGTKLEWKGSV